VTIGKTDHDHQPVPGTAANNEIDSNADTCCLGKNFIVLEHTSRTADVHARDKTIAPALDVPIATGATAWTDHASGQTFILVINEGLCCGEKLDHASINPNQTRDHGVPLWDNPHDNTRGLNIEVNDEVNMSVRTKGTKVVFNSRAPTQEELDSCQKIVLTSLRHWNPKNVQLREVTNENMHYQAN